MGAEGGGRRWCQRTSRREELGVDKGGDEHIAKAQCKGTMTSHSAASACLSFCGCGGAAGWCCWSLSFQRHLPPPLLNNCPLLLCEHNTPRCGPPRSHPVLACCCVDALVPQGPHVGLLVAPVCVGMLQRLFCLLARDLEAVFGPAPKSLCYVPHPPPVQAHVWALIFGSRRGCLLMLMWVLSMESVALRSWRARRRCCCCYCCAHAHRATRQRE